MTAIAAILGPRTFNQDWTRIMRNTPANFANVACTKALPSAAEQQSPTPRHSQFSAAMRSPRPLLAAAFLLASIVPPAFAGNFWQPLCPDGALCATAGQAFVANGKVLMSPGDNSDLPSQWVDATTLAGMTTGMRDVSILAPSGNYLAVSGPRFTTYDAGGNLLYGHHNSSIEFQVIFESHATALGPALYFGATSPATVFSGLTLPGQAPYIYLSRDEGRTDTMQTANILMDGGRTNFAVSADGQRVWVIPGPATAGLWQTPVAAGGSAQLDFTRLSRVDDGSFPADVLQFRTVHGNANAPGGYAVALATDGMYISTDSGRSWSRATFSGLVDDIAFPTPNSADSQVIAARGSVYLSLDRGQTWSEFGRGLPADQYVLSAVNGGVVADGRGGVFVCGALDCAGPAFGKQATSGANFSRVTEFHNTTLNHYFITADENEKTAIRSGAAGAGWVETGQNFWAWTPNVLEESAFVCRFYGDPVKGPNSHFYSASTDECRSLLGLQLSTPVSEPRWNSEGYEFKVSLPDAGKCRSGLVPIYRAYNDGFAHGVDSNHRYVVDRALLAPLLANGWKDEGIAFCVPAAAGA